MWGVAIKVDPIKKSTWVDAEDELLGMGRGVEAKRCANWVHAAVRDQQADEVLASLPLLLLTALGECGQVQPLLIFEAEGSSLSMHFHHGIYFCGTYYQHKRIVLNVSEAIQQESNEKARSRMWPERGDSRSELPLLLLSIAENRDPEALGESKPPPWESLPLLSCNVSPCSVCVASRAAAQECSLFPRLLTPQCWEI